MCKKQLERVQGSENIKGALSGVIAKGAILDRAGLGAPISLIENLVEHQKAMLSITEREKLLAGNKQLPLQVDAILQLQATTLRSSIGRAAARAGAFLLSQTPLIDGWPHLKEYRMRFQETYGEGAEVPLLDLLSPENGLDAPEGYERPRRTYRLPPRVQTQSEENGPRNRLLLNLVMNAVNTESLEVELTDDIQRRLARWTPKLEDAPLSLEIYLHVQATSREAIDQGEWSAMVGRHWGSPSGGRTFGRFFDLWKAPDLAALRSLLKREEELLPDVIFAEISYQPWKARQANVAIRPPLRTYEIAVGITPSVLPERVIPLNDLVVGVQNGRFYVRSQRLRKRVLVCQSHMLNTRVAPNPCRFISEIANDGQPQVSEFDWGAAIHAPFLPRVFIKEGKASKLVLTPARWYLQEETIEPEGAGSEEARWFKGLQRWRKQWRVPRYVYLSEIDQRLLVDLEHPLMVEEVRNALGKAKAYGRVALDELLPDFEHLWLRDSQDKGYFSEIVVPLLRADAFKRKANVEEAASVEEKPLLSQNTEFPNSPTHSTAQPLSYSLESQRDSPKQCGPRERVLLARERRRFPGEDWAYLKLYAALSQHEEIIAGPLREIVSVLQKQKLIDRWFFIRYFDPEPHLRVRFHAREGVDVQTIHTNVLPWSAHLARHGLLQRSSLETYEREVERYGGPDAIDLVERAFTTDSASVSNIIASRYARQITLDLLLVTVWTLDRFFEAWGWKAQQRLLWVQNATVNKKYAFSQEFHRERNLYCDLFAPQGHTKPELIEQYTRLCKLVRPQEEELGILGAQVRKLAEMARLWVTEETLMGSLTRMHVNRLMGIDRAQEARVYAFWRYTLESLERRPEKTRQEDS